jgi:starch phosphorylase
MPVLALRFSRRSNAVSALHGRTSRAMWHGLWSEVRAEQVPIGHVTNGVHVPTWIASDMARFFSENLSPDWPGA